MRICYLDRPACLYESFPPELPQDHVFCLFSTDEIRKYPESFFKKAGK